MGVRSWLCKVVAGESATLLYSSVKVECNEMVEFCYNGFIKVMPRIKIYIYYY